MPQTEVPLMPPTSRVKIDRWAERFLAKHYPKNLNSPTRLNVDHLLSVVLESEYGIEFVIDELPVGVEGITDPPNRLTIPPDTYGRLETDGRARFTGTHEAYHAVKHLPQLRSRYISRGSTKLYRRSEIPTPYDPEWQANRGAAALLMPARIVWELVKQYGFNAEPLVELLGVSKTAAEFRINDAEEGRLWRPT